MPHGTLLSVLTVAHLVVDDVSASQALAGLARVLGSSPLPCQSHQGQRAHHEAPDSGGGIGTGGGTRGLRGGGTTSPAAPPTGAPATSATPAQSATSSSPSAGADRFAADLERTGFGQKDTSDPAFIRVGNGVCTGLNDGVSYGNLVQGLAESVAKPTRRQAENFMRSSVENLCPEYASRLP